MSLSRGGLGLPPESAVDIDSLATTPCQQHTLSTTLESTQFNSLLTESSTADKAHLLSVSSPHASAWLSAVPSPGLGLSLDPNEHQMAIKWWLGLDTSPNSPPCALCPEHPLDPLGLHALTCKLTYKQSGDAVSRHNKLRDVVLQTCHRACISAKAEAGSGLGRDLQHTHPADILASNWLCGKPPAFDLSVTSSLNPSLLSEAGLTAGSPAVAAELRKHSPMMLSVLSWDGQAFPLWWNHMELGAGKLSKLSQDLLHTLPQGPTPPSRRWSPTCMAA